MFTRKSERRNEPQPPTECALLTPTVGVALWAVDGGDFDVKIGEAYRSRTSGVVVRSTFRMGEQMADFLQALVTVTEACANEPSMPAAKRQMLLAYASAVQTAIESVAYDSTDGLNGEAKRGILG